MANRTDFVADKSYRIRFQTGQELDCKFIDKKDDRDSRLKFVFASTGTLRIFPFDIELVSEISDIGFAVKRK